MGLTFDCRYNVGVKATMMIASITSAHVGKNHGCRCARTLGLLAPRRGSMVSASTGFPLCRGYATCRASNDRCVDLLWPQARINRARRWRVSPLRHATQELSGVVGIPNLPLVVQLGEETRGSE